MITIVKFIENPNQESENRIITKTLGKYGVFNANSGLLNPDNTPSPNEFWEVEILKEVLIHKEDGGAGGCFILRPIRNVGVKKMNGKDIPNVEYLIPGAYDTVRYKTSLVIVPRTLGEHWFCGLDVRHHLRDQYYRDGKFELHSLVVSLDGDTDWPVDDVYRGQPKPSKTIYSERSAVSS